MRLLAAVSLAALAAAPAADEPAARREALRARIGEDGVAVVLAPADTDSFRQNPSFAYLVGLDEPEAALVLEPGNREQPETLYLRPRDRASERWTGPALAPGDIDPATGDPDAERRAAQERSGIAAVRSLVGFEADLARRLARGRKLWVEAGAVAPSRPLTRELMLVEEIRRRQPALEVGELGPLLREQRMIKSKDEIARIARACEITMEAQREVAADLRPGRREYEVKALLEYAFGRAGAQGPAFPSIVASGPNGAVLHYRGDRREIVASDLVVVDIGARWDGYAADITRTYPASGRFTPRQREVYETVLRAQEAALARVRTGARLRSDVHQAAVEVIEAAGFKGRFPHATSHHLGLETHDPGERDGVLKPGMVITVEPGIYLPDEGFGVRIEDVVVVTAKGYDHLTRDLPRRPEEIEALMAAGGAPAAGRANPARRTSSQDRARGAPGGR